MIAELFHSLRALLALTVLTGVMYPIAVTVCAQLFFRTEANGSLVQRAGQPCGSQLLAQAFRSPGYFWPRPSAADFATIPSGAGNQGFTSRKLQTQVEERRAAWGERAQADLLTASASGLDPHISLEAALYQAPRVAAARGWPEERVDQVVRQVLEPPQWGFFGQPRVNVLLLNLAIDQVK